MDVVCWLVYLSSAYPLGVAWRANRSTSLLHALGWAGVAWTAWGAVLAAEAFAPETSGQVRYVALGLTGCAGVAVLGARRPGVGAWNFVVGGLLAVMLVSLAQNVVFGRDIEPGLRKAFLATTLAVGVLNYLPTRFAFAASMLATAAALEILSLPGPESPKVESSPAVRLGHLLVTLTPWVAYAAVRGRSGPLSDFDRLWLDFRDRFGLLWGQRLREQFNRSAANAGWPVYLRWQGLRLEPGAPLPDPATRAETVAVLRALLKRFGPPAEGTG